MGKDLHNLIWLLESAKKMSEEGEYDEVRETITAMKNLYSKGEFSEFALKAAADLVTQGERLLKEILPKYNPE